MDCLKPFVLISLLSASVLTAAEPRINRLEPQGVRRGAEVEVKLVGQRLGQQPEEIVFYEPGIEVVELKQADKNAALAKLKIAEDCTLGRHAIRLRTETGLSNLVTLHVGVLEAVAEKEPNNTIDKAQPIPFSRTVHGVVKREDEDLFVFEAAEGQRVSIEVEGLRLGRTFFDPVIEVLNPAGEVIAENDDQTATYSDPFLSFTAEQTGKLIVRVRESAYRGDDKASYLLHIGDFPRPTAVFPPVAQRGGEQSVRWVGGSEFDQPVTVPEDAGPHYEAFAHDQAGAAPSSNLLYVADSAPLLEVEPNDKREQATAIDAPGVAAGVIGSPNDQDFFLFKADKKQVFDLRVRARELRSPLDSVMRVFSKKGKRLAGNDDDRGKPDSYLRFTAPEKGEYLIQVEDRLLRGDKAFTYALEVAPPRPVVDVKLEERRRFQATVLEVPQGGRCAALLTVTRRNLGGELQLDFGGLPAGVTAECFPLAGNYNRVPVVFTAAEDIQLATGLSTLTAARTATDKPQEVETRFEQQTWFVRGRNNRPVWSHFAHRVPVAVTKRLPFSLSLTQPKAPLFKNGSLQLKVTAERDEGFDQAISVKMLYHSPGVSSNRSRSIVKGATEATIPVTANGKARLGEWPITVVGETNLNGRVYVSTQFVTLQVADALFDIGVPTITTKQGVSPEVKVSLTHRTEFEGPAKLELVGLPNGVTSTPIEVTAGQSEAVFQLKIAANARPGRHRGVGVRASLTIDGQAVNYRHGYAEFRIDPVDQTTEQTADSPSRRKETTG